MSVHNADNKPGNRKSRCGHAGPNEERVDREESISLAFLMLLEQFLSFGGSQILLTVSGGPTQDKPTVTFGPPADADRVSSELATRVPDCSAAYEVLRSRGAEYLAIASPAIAAYTAWALAHSPASAKSWPIPHSRLNSVAIKKTASRPLLA